MGAPPPSPHSAARSLLSTPPAASRRWVQQVSQQPAAQVYWRAQSPECLEPRFWHNCRSLQAAPAPAPMHPIRPRWSLGSSAQAIAEGQVLKQSAAAKLEASVRTLMPPQEFTFRY